MIEIVSPGVMASVQDCGRTGARNIGVGVSGAMDVMALHVGNLLVGNDPGLAGIEFTLGGFSVLFCHDTTFALTGANINVCLDGVPVPTWWVRRAKAGQILTAGMATSGMRTMLTVSGGITVPLVMGSRSTDLKGGFGGHEGRLLQSGDRLETGTQDVPVVPMRGFGLDPRKLDLLAPETDTEVRFLPAGEWLRTPAAVRNTFTATAWTLRPDSNRMGYRLSGPALQRDTPLEMLSHAIVPGTIQLPPDGSPVIQLNDANTCGGYPKLGVVIDADLPLLAQARLGTSIQFTQVDRITAITARQKRRTFLDWLPGRIALARDYAQRFEAV